MALFQHAHRVAVTNQLKNDVVQLNHLLAQTTISHRDQVYIQTWMDNISGKGQIADGITKWAEKVNSFFWMMYPLQISHATHYTARNLLQPLLMHAHMSEAEILRSAARVWTGHASPELKQSMKNNWQFITQKEAIRQQMMFLAESASQGPYAFTGQKLHEAKDSIKLVGAVIPLSDEINRLHVYPIFFESALRNSKEYASGKKSFDSLRSSLFLDAMSEAQINLLENDLLSGDHAKFAHRFAQYKTEIVNFKYGREARSMFEQTRGGRSVFGLANFMRGMWQQVYRNSAEPTMRGIKDKDLRTAYQGVVSGTTLYIALRIAQEIYFAILGRKERDVYDLADTFFGINPGSVGLNKLATMNLMSIRL
jgi:hypothetical protein